MEDKLEFLLELLSEEIPAIMQKDAEAAYQKIFTDYFANLGIKDASVVCYIGPRRVTIHGTNIAKIMPATITELKGPNVKAPTAAVAGFAKANSASKEQLEIKELKGQQYYYFTAKKPAEDLLPILASTLPEAIGKYVWPKSMQWGNYAIKWVRPLTSILCLFGDEIVPVKYGHLTAGNKTYGHRFMGNNQLIVSSFADYHQQLTANKVMLSRLERRSFIQQQLESVTQTNKLTLLEDSALLDEVTGLVEWPLVLLGKIEERFLKLPSEVLTCSMRSHQKYFSCLDQRGNFAPYFLFASNIESAGDNSVLKGNEQVLAARLSDGLYFYQQDQQTSIANWRQKLHVITFHSQLGTLYSKTQRMAKLASYLSGGDENAILAAELAKSDIPTNMVDEFPSLQGVIGGYYAKDEGLPAEVSGAITEHYLPQGQKDSLPATKVAAYVSLSDKIDTLVGMMLIGQRPTGSKDPFALRRQALGIIRVIIGHQLDVELDALIDFACSLYSEIKYSKNNVDEIIEFISSRAQHYYKEQHAYNIVLSAVNLNREPNILVAQAKLQAANSFLQTQDGANLLELFKRCRNILGKDHNSQPELDTSLLKLEQEQNLLAKLTEIEPQISQHTRNHNFIAAMDDLLTIRPAITEFFAEIMVNTEDKNLAAARTSLVAKVKDICNMVLQFDQL